MTFLGSDGRTPTATEAHVHGSREDPGAGQAWKTRGDSENRQMLEHAIETGRLLPAAQTGGVCEVQVDTPNSARSNHTHLVMEKTVR